MALVKEEAWDRTGGVAVREREREEGLAPQAEWTAKKWTRWMRVVFAPWMTGCGEAERGLEFEVWSGGVRCAAASTIGREGVLDKAEVV